MTKACRRVVGPRAPLLLLATLACALLALSPNSALAQRGASGPPEHANVEPVNHLPNPYETVRDWGVLPDGRTWGSVSAVNVDIDGIHIWAADRCGTNSCALSDVDPIVKLDPNGNVVESFGAGLILWPHGMDVDSDGNVWIADARSANARELEANPAAAGRGHAVLKFSPTGELLMSLGTAGQPGSGPGQLNQPNDVITAPDGSIFVSDGHNGQGMTTMAAMADGREAGSTGRILKYSADGTFLKEWGQIGRLHGEFRTPHALAFDSQGRLFVADRGNHRIEIFDQEGNYLDSRYSFGRISGLFITADDILYAIDSESSMTSHANWMNGVRIGPVDGDHITGFIPPFDADTRPYQGAAGEGVAVDADGNVYAAEGPNSLRWAGGALTKYVKGM